MNLVNNQTDIILVKKFSQWNYVSSSLRERMPYLTPNDPNTILTTAGNPQENQFGTIVSRNASHSPALWIEGVANDPQVIWYWMREAKGDYHYHYYRILEFASIDFDYIPRDLTKRETFKN